MKLTEEARPEHAFYFADGSSLKSPKELADKLKKAEHSHYLHHASTERNDFHNWIKDVYLDEKLAKKVLAAKNGSEAAAIIEKEIKNLSAKPKKATAKAKKTRKPKKGQLRAKNRKPKKAAKAKKKRLHPSKRKFKAEAKKEKYKNSKTKRKKQRKRKSMKIRSYLKVFAQKYGLI